MFFYLHFRAGIDVPRTKRSVHILELVLVDWQAPDAVVDVLRAAFEETMRDPDFRADAEKRQLDLDFTSGAEIQSIIEKIYKTPPAVVERVKKIVQAAE